MKKTIIAASIAAVVAAPAAFADVTISGMVNMERLDTGAATGADFSTNTDLVFTASEDMGNGMKAGMRYHYTNDDGALTGGANVADTSAYVSGDFGKLTVGRMETINQSYFHPFAAGDAAHDMTLEDTNGQQGRVNAVAYASPSFNGLNVMGALFQMTAGTQGVDTNDTDATEIADKYSNGGLTNGANVADTSVFLSGDFGQVTVGRMETINQSYFHPFAAGDAAHDMTLEDANGQQARVNAVAYASPSFNGLTVMGALVQMTAGTQGVDTNDTDATEIAAKYSNGGLTVAAGRTIHKGSVADETITNIAASYNMGDLTFAILNRDVEDDGNVLNADNELTTVSVKYAMGSNTLYAGFNDSDDGQDGDYVVSFAHNLSKRTSAYVA
jgi:predicted porin